MCLQHNVVLLYLLWPNPAVAGAVFPPSGDGGLLNLVDNPKIQYIIRHSKKYNTSLDIARKYNTMYFIRHSKKI